MEVFNRKDNMRVDCVKRACGLKVVSEMILAQFICFQPVEWTKCLHGFSQKNCERQAESSHVEEEKEKNH